MSIAIQGMGSKIIQELLPLLPACEEAIRIERGEWIVNHFADRYIFAGGLLRNLPLLHQTHVEMQESLSVNMVDVMAAVEMILESNDSARICVIGSESGWKGSYDEIYAVAKAGLHQFVKWRGRRSRMKPGQQLSCVAPCIISDAGMTLRRHDYPQVLKERRTVTALQVAKTIQRVLYHSKPHFYTGIVLPCYGFVEI